MNQDAVARSHLLATRIELQVTDTTQAKLSSKRFRLDNLNQ